MYVFGEMKNNKERTLCFVKINRNRWERTILKLPATYHLTANLQ